MISKDYLVSRDKKEGLKASFISDKGVWLERCKSFLEEQQTCIGQTQQACDEIFKGWISKGEGGVMCRRGLLQTLQKKMVWEDIEASNWEGKRFSILEQSVEMWRNSQSLEAIQTQLQLDKAHIEESGIPSLYGDLPQYRKLLEVPDWQPKQWIQRYNLGLAQGFLLNATVMDWHLKEITLEKLRYLFRYLKFFGLYFRVIEQEEASLVIRIEGPLEIFSGSKRYRLKMAAVAGILPQLGSFELRAKLDKNISKQVFVWSDQDKVKSHYRPFFEYQSPEREQFETKLCEWLVKNKCDLIHPECSMADLMKDHVPDYCLLNQNGERLHLHIYEKHQKSMLLNRTVKKENSIKTILLIEKDLKEVQSIHENESVLNFNKVPTITVLKKLTKEMKFI